MGHRSYELKKSVSSLDVVYALEEAAGLVENALVPLVFFSYYWEVKVLLLL